MEIAASIAAGLFIISPFILKLIENHLTKRKLKDGLSAYAEF